MKNQSDRPHTLHEVAAQASSLEEFGLLLRDWIHYVTRRDVSNRPALALAISQAPSISKKKFTDGEVADAYLAAYAEWIADQAAIDRPLWTRESKRSLKEPWFSDNARASLLIDTPASFRQRGIFTIPEKVVCLRRGRPRVSTEQKRNKARERDRRYREKVREKLQKFKQLEEAGLV